VLLNIELVTALITTLKLAGFCWNI